MPLNASAVGTAGRPITIDVEARWTMSYAAALGDTYPCYFDTTRPDGVVAHPLFPVCVEWQRRFDDPRHTALTPDEGVRGVHYSHHLTNHRLVRPGDRITTTSTLVAVERHRAGAYMQTRYDAVDAEGTPIWTTYTGSMLLGVEVEGVDTRIDGLPEFARSDGFDDVQQIAIRAEEAHVYTECARIWNPIHTDEAVARSAGLPGIILHGTATLAHAVSRLAGDRPETVKTVAGRFGAMVPMPTQLALHSRRDGSCALFEVRTAEGAPAIRHGLIEFARA